VKTQPLRTSALGAACTLRVATMMTAMNHPEEARALYRSPDVVTVSGPCYVDQAKEALAGLSDPSAAVVASRSTPASFH